MRRSYLAGALVALLVVVALAPSVFAQAPPAPAPKVTITGFLDTVTSWTKNLSTVDNNYGRIRAGEDEWFARNRVRPDITAEIGTSKFVLGLEIDAVWGQTGAADSALLTSCTATPCTNGPNRSGATAGSFDLNTDLLGGIEVKWAYAEFMAPIIPWPTTIRVGAQPWAATYKLAVLANGDFAGVNVRSVITPVLALNATYAQVEEESTGLRDGFPRGEDFAFVGSVEITPFKGLQIRPLYSFFFAEGTTNTAARQGRGGVANADANFSTGFVGGLPTPGASHATERRHTVGVDVRLSAGPFYFDPTVLYQFGERESFATGPFVGLGKQEADRSAWLVDLRGGWRGGPLLLEAALIYTTGNSAREDLRSGRRQIDYFEPISTDTSYYATWADIWALGIEYYNILYAGAAGLNPGVAIGYDKYGLARVGARASYDITPAFTVRATATGNWAAEKVDSASTLTAAGGLTPGDGRGNGRYLGTEVDLGFTYRFAPGVVFDVTGSYMWAGPAMSIATTPTGSGRDPEDVKAVASRVRFSF
jgi:hypothetical protein